MDVTIVLEMVNGVRSKLYIIKINMGILNKLFNKNKKEKEVKKNMAKKKGDILVKVGRTGGKPVEISLNGDRSVASALRAAGFAKKEAEIVNVNGVETDDMDMELEDGDRVILVKNIQGGIR